MERNTPNYINEEEEKYGRTSTKAPERAMKFEERARELKKFDCVQDLEREEAESIGGNWGKKRKNTMENKGLGKEAREKLREEAERDAKEMVQRAMGKVVTKEEEERKKDRRVKIRHRVQGIDSRGITGILKEQERKKRKVCDRKLLVWK